MVQTLEQGIKKLQLGSKMRSDVWMRELDRCVITPFAKYVVLKENLQPEEPNFPDNPDRCLRR